MNISIGGDGRENSYHGDRDNKQHWVQGGSSRPFNGPNSANISGNRPKFEKKQYTTNASGSRFDHKDNRHYKYDGDSKDKS